MKFQYLYLWALVFILFGCETSKTITSEPSSKDASTNESMEGTIAASTEKPFLVVSFEQTACMGSCPVHKLTISSSGNANYHGNRNVKFQGDFIALVSNSQIQEILNTADSLEFFDLEDTYTANITDLPTTIVYINDGNQKKKVVAYGNYPDNLKEFITFLYDFSQSVNWQENK